MIQAITLLLFQESDITIKRQTKLVIACFVVDRCIFLRLSSVIGLAKLGKDSSVGNQPV